MYFPVPFPSSWNVNYDVVLSQVILSKTRHGENRRTGRMILDNLMYQELLNWDVYMLMITIVYNGSIRALIILGMH